MSFSSFQLEALIPRKPGPFDRTKEAAVDERKVKYPDIVINRYLGAVPHITVFAGGDIWLGTR